MHGGQLGIELFNTYFDISGTDGHSVFNIYRLISGIGGQGGTDDFKTHFVGSGEAHGAHSFSKQGLQGRGLGQAGGGDDPKELEDDPKILEDADEFIEENGDDDVEFILHPHGLDLLHTLHEGGELSRSSLCDLHPQGLGLLQTLHDGEDIGVGKLSKKSVFILLHPHGFGLWQILHSLEFSNFSIVILDLPSK